MILVKQQKESKIRKIKLEKDMNLQDVINYQKRVSSGNGTGFRRTDAYQRDVATNTTSISIVIWIIPLLISGFFALIAAFTGRKTNTPDNRGDRNNRPEHGHRDDYRRDGGPRHGRW